MDLPNFTNPEKNVTELGIFDGMRVADLGAGTGAYIEPLARRVGESGRVYAVEVQKDFLTNIRDLALRHNLKNVEVIWGDIEQPSGTKIKDESLGAAIISNVLFLAEDKQGLLREAKRILKPGGKLLLVDWRESFGNLGPAPTMVVSQSSARDFLTISGFTIAKEFSAGEHHYGFVAVKQ